MRDICIALRGKNPVSGRQQAGPADISLPGCLEGGTDGVSKLACIFFIFRDTLLRTDTHINDKT
jgi:hypothetical protein